MSTARELKNTRNETVMDELALRQLKAGIAAARNVYTDGGENGLSGHGPDFPRILELLRSHQDSDVLEEALLDLAGWAPNFLLKHIALYANKPYAQKVVATAIGNATHIIRHDGLNPRDALPYNAGDALFAMENAGTLTLATMLRPLADVLMTYEVMFRRIYTERTDFTEPNAHRISFNRHKKWFDRAAEIRSPQTIVTDTRRHATLARAVSVGPQV